MRDAYIRPEHPRRPRAEWPVRAAAPPAAAENSRQDRRAPSRLAITGRQRRAPKNVITSVGRFGLVRSIGVCVCVFIHLCELPVLACKPTSQPARQALLCLRCLSSIVFVFAFVLIDVAGAASEHVVSYHHLPFLLCQSKAAAAAIDSSLLPLLHPELTSANHSTAGAGAEVGVGVGAEAEADGRAE